MSYVISRDGTAVAVAELVEVPGQDHMVTADALAPLLRAFLTGNGDR